MAPNKQLLAAWRKGETLGSAWLVFADNRNRKLFRERQREGKGFHLGIQHTLEIDLIGRLEDGQLKAYGIEDGSDDGPIRIAEYYFSRTAKIDFDNDTITALGKKFYEVRVQGDREPPDVKRPSGPLPVIDLRKLAAQREQERLRETPPSVQKTSREPTEISDQGERERLRETPPSVPKTSREPTEISDQKDRKPLPSERSPSKARGRPSKSPEIHRAIDILLEKGVDLANMPRPKAYKVVRKCAEAELKSNIKIGFADPVIQRALFRRFGARR